MSEASHAPGPWEAEPPEKIMLDERWRVTAPLTRGKRRHTVAVLAGHSPDEIDYATTAANARLIAAAPDLLAACEQALRHLDSHGNAASNAAVADALSDAIRKATKGD